MEHIQARWYHEGRLKPVRLIVVHCTVSPESGTGAEAVANYFKAGTRKASAHRVSDSNSTVMCVDDHDTAFGAAGANADGLHLELCGYPDQTVEQWLDAYGRAMFRESGKTIREWASEFKIPHRWLTVAQIRAGADGFCTHNDVSLAYPDVSTGHWDPGPNFPKYAVMSLWFPTTPTPTPPPEDDDDMKMICKGDKTSEWWITDGITKRHVNDRTEAAQLVYVGLAKWDPNWDDPAAGKGGPYVLPESMVTDITTVPRATTLS